MPHGRFTSRRKILRLLGSTAILGLASACAPIAPPRPTAAPADSSQAQKAAPAAPAPAAPAKPAAPVAQPAATPAPAKPAAAPATPAPKRGGTLKMMHPGDVRDFDGHGLWLRSWPIMGQLYNTLLRLDAKLDPQPELAESWKLADDSKSVTLKLRAGVKWHSGRELVAEDVKANIERIQVPATASQMRPLAQGIGSIGTPDKTTVVLNFNRAHLAVFDLLDSMQLVDPEGFGEVKSKGVGTGPFKFAEWQPGNLVRMVRNPDYWRAGYPLLDEIVVQAANDLESMAVSLEAKAIHLVEQPTPQSVARFKSSPDLKVVAIEQWGLAQDMIMNLRRPPFDKPEVRQAINHAVNRPRFVEIALSGLGVPSCLPIPQGSWAWDAALAGSCAYDLDKAKQLLEKAGVGGGFEASFIVRGNSQPQVQLGQILQGDLAKIGVKIKVETLEDAVHEKSLTDGNFDFAAHDYGRANKDPDTLFRATSAWRPTQTYSGFEFQEYKDKIDAGSATSDRAKRKDAYRDLFGYILQGPATLSIAGRFFLFAHTTALQDFAHNLDGMELLERAWLTG